MEYVQQEQRCDLCNKVIKTVRVKVPEHGAADWLDKFQYQTFDRTCSKCFDEQEEDFDREFGQAERCMRDF